MRYSQVIDTRRLVKNRVEYIQEASNSVTLKEHVELKTIFERLK